MADRIHIRDLTTRCIIGVRDWERVKPQDVVINITLHADLRAAGKSDELGDTVDYVTIRDRVIGLVEASSYQLVERLAEAVADACLEDPRVEQADVTLDKPGALRFTRSAAAEISRRREN